jgi:hypothetical protein
VLVNKKTYPELELRRVINKLLHACDPLISPDNMQIIRPKVRDHPLRLIEARVAATIVPPADIGATEHAARILEVALIVQWVLA